MINWLVLNVPKGMSRKSYTNCYIIKLNDTHHNTIQYVYEPWFVINNKHSTSQNSMGSSGKHSKMHALAWYHRWRHWTLLPCKTPNTNSQLPVLSPARIRSGPKCRQPQHQAQHQKQEIMQGTNNFKHLKNTKASPATNLLEVTNVLQPVVSKCLLGWPDHILHKGTIKMVSKIVDLRTMLPCIPHSILITIFIHSKIWKCN